jgi:hypothetical protein
MRAPATWQEAAAACGNREWRLAGSLLLRHIHREPAAAAAALLLIYDAHEAGELGVDGVGLSRMDAPAGERLGQELRDERSVQRARDVRCVKKLANRYSQQVMQLCAAWDPDVTRANVRRLFAGCDTNGELLELGGGGAVSDEDEDEADEGDLEGFVVQDGEGEEEDDSGDEDDDASDDDEEALGGSDGALQEEDPSARRTPHATPAHATPRGRNTLASAAARDTLAARVDALRAACTGADALAASMHRQLAAARRNLRAAEARAAADAANVTPSDDEDEDEEDVDGDEPPLAASAARTAARLVKRKRKLLFASSSDDDEDDDAAAPVLTTPAPQRERSTSPLPPGLLPGRRRLRQARQ